MFFGVVLFVIFYSQILTAIHVHDESSVTFSHHNAELQVMMNEEDDDIPTNDILSNEDLRNYFDTLVDIDQNGVADVDEVINWYAITINLPITIEVAKLIISAIDNNEDGKVSFDEFHNAYMKLIG
ncbi:hypothetical protein P8452_46019 [Trifolium repens]|nr:hypothetical protein P8452_46019 [Trifolium repens]